MDIKISVPIGDIIDKLTILKIKSERITDTKRLVFINEEIDILNEALKMYEIFVDDLYFNRLKKINEKIWETEEILRKNDVDTHKFIKHAKNNAIFNDERFVVKNEINKVYNSRVQEQKAHNSLYNNSN